MATARFAWGIDVGNRALKAIKLVRGDSGLRIDDFEVIEHENVLSNAGDNKEALIQAALANFVQRHPSKGGVAAISVSGVSSFARFIKLPPSNPRKSRTSSASRPFSKFLSPWTTWNGATSSSNHPILPRWRWASSRCGTNWSTSTSSTSRT